MRKIVPAFVLIALAAAGLADDEKQKPALLGVTVGPLDAEMKKEADVEGGAVIQVVVPGSAADRAGFKVGDVVVFFDGKTVGTPDDLVGAVSARRAGDKVTYKLRRGSGTIEGMVMLGSRVQDPGPPAGMRFVPVPPQPGRVGPRPARDLEEIERRIEEALKSVAALRKQAAARRRSLPIDKLVAKENKALDAAKAKGDETAMLRHKHRIELLHELSEWEARWTAKAAAQPKKAKKKRPAPQQRIDRLEKRLDQIAKRLERLEQQSK